MRKPIIRKCIATGVQYEKKDLFRIVRTPELTVIVDQTGRVNGRGAYLAKTKEAIAIAQKKDLLSRALEIKVPLEIYQQLLEVVGE